MNEDESEDFEYDEPTHPAELATRVLVVEDDGALREMITLRLRREGFDVFEARSGDEALDILAVMARHRWPSDDVDLILMDVRMPGTSGLEVTRMLRGAEWTTPVLLITAYPDPELLAQAAQLHVSVLGKPFALDDLSTAALAALAREPMARSVH